MHKTMHALLTVAAAGALVCWISLPAGAQQADTGPNVNVEVQQEGQFGPGPTVDTPGTAETSAESRENDLEMPAVEAKGIVKADPKRGPDAAQLEQTGEFQSGAQFGDTADTAMDHELDLQEITLTPNQRP